jgi:hypothetical protein
MGDGPGTTGELAMTVGTLSHDECQQAGSGVMSAGWVRHPDGIELIPRPEPSAADMGGDYLMTWRDEQMHARIYEAPPCAVG